MSVTGSAPAARAGAAAGASLGFRPGLDGLRAIAVLAVIAYHLGAGWMRGGFLGVDLFMVLSGYLITALLLIERERTGRIALGGFWARRARRILPAVVVLLLALAVHAEWWASPVERAALRWDALASLTSWANWRFIVDGSGYWAQFGPPSPLTHMWSLAVEEQFYVVWPLVVGGLLLIGRHRAVLVVTVVGIVASALAMAWWYDPGFPSRAYLGTDTRVQTLLVGALGAVLLRPGPERSTAPRLLVRRVAPAAALLVAVMLVTADDRAAWMYRGGFTLFAFAALAVVVAAGDAAGPSLLRARALQWIGRRSFGWYLWHWPVIVLAGAALTGAGRVATVLGVTIVAAEVSYRLVEQPIRHARPGGRIGRAAVPVASAGAIAVTAALVVATTTVTPPPRPDLRVSDLVAATTTTPSTPATPSTSSASSASSTSGSLPPVVPGDPRFPGIGDVPIADAVAGLDPPVEPVTDDLIDAATIPAASDRPVRRILLQGDSVAIFSALPLGEALAAVGIELDDRTFPGQSLANPDVVRAVETSGADLSVWYVSMWDDGPPDEVEEHHERFVAASTATGADVVFVDRPPVAPEHETPERQWPRALAARSAGADPTRVHFLDPAPVWGDRFVVDADGDGLPERMIDGVHVCPQGSARWTAWFLEELAARYTDVTVPDPTTWLDGDWLDDPHWAANVGQCDPVERRDPSGL